MHLFLGFLNFHIFSIFFPLSHWFFYVSWLWKSDEICSWWQLVWVFWVILAVSPPTVVCIVEPFLTAVSLLALAIRYLCFFLSANRSQEPLREFCQHYIISIFSFNSERYFGFKSEDTDWRLHCYFVDFFLFSQLYSLTKEDESLCKVHAKRKFLMT